MAWLRRTAILGGMLAFAICSGCGGGDSGEKGGDKGKPAAEDKPAATSSGGLKSVDISKLPAVGDPLPPQDDGRVEPAPPQGWKAAPRDNKFVARFSRKTGELPRIDITAAVSPFPGMEEVTAENAADFAAKMEKAPGKRAMIEGFKPLKIGDRIWSRSVRKVKYGSYDSQIQSLSTLVGGRLYTVDLIVLGQTADELLAERDYGYAVAANMKFKPDEKRPPLTVPVEQPAEGNPTPDPNPNPNPNPTP